MTFAQLRPGAIHQVPSLVSSVVDVVGSFRHGMFVETVEARGVDEAERRFVNISELQRGVAHDYTTARVENTEDGAEMNAVLLVPDSMSQHS